MQPAGNSRLEMQRIAHYFISHELSPLGPSHTSLLDFGRDLSRPFFIAQGKAFEIRYAI